MSLNEIDDDLGVPAIQKDGSLKWVKLDPMMPLPEYGHEMDDPNFYKIAHVPSIYNTFEKKYITDNLEIVPTELDRITEIFGNKMISMYSGPSERVIQENWREYLTKDLGLEVISSETYLANSLDYLLERIYSGAFDSVVVKDPSTPMSPNFILMSRDFAQKVLVLGGLP